MGNEENRRASGSDRFARRHSALRTPHSAFLPRRALTLIELLVVIVILTTLVAAAIPLLAPARVERRLREASRGLNTFITGAQAKSIQLQRPFGVALKKLSQATFQADDNGVCLEAFYVEQPPPYAGFDETSAVRVCIDPDTAALPNQVLIQFVRRGTLYNDLLPAGWDHEELPPGVLRPGDVIEVGGTRYTFIEDDATGIDDSGFYKKEVGEPDGTLAALPINDSGQLLNFVDRDLDTARFPNRFWTLPFAYKVLRQPVYTSDPPYQLPDGTAVDLRASGVTISDPTGTEIRGFFHNPDSSTSPVDNSDPIVIMFSPEGSVERLRLNQKSGSGADDIYDQPVTSTIYLLLGRREIIPAPPLASDPTLNPVGVAGMTDQQRQEAKAAINWLRGDSRWVAIGAQSGRVITAENAFVELQALIPIMATDIRLARNQQIVDARTIAQEMTQMGGR